MDTEVLSALVDAKLTLLKQLRELSARQVQVVEGGDMSRLMSLLGVKQRLLSSIGEVERRLDPFRNEDPDQRVWKAPALRQRTSEQSTRCNDLLNEIMAIERECEAKLLLRRDHATEQLKAAHFSTHATNAYNFGQPSAGGQLDVSCET